MTERLTLDELARRSGAREEALQEWRALGLIGCEDAAAFAPGDVQRVRLIRVLLRRGVALDRIAQRERTEGFLRNYLAVLPQAGGPTYSLSHVVERTGLDVRVLRRLVDAAGLGEPDEALFPAEDVKLLQGVKVMLESGLPEEAIVQLLRVYAEALGRVAEAEARLFHFYVHERLRAEGASGPDLMAATDTARRRMLPLVDPTILYFHRKGFVRAVEDDAILHLQEDMGFPVPGQLRLAVAFVDLASFTPLAEAMGDETAARILARFSQLVHEAVRRCDGRAVKQIGDAFMLVFSDVRAAVTCTAEIERQALAEPQFPAIRAGMQWGDVLYRAGDYVGANVNIAARLAAAAERHQLLVTAGVKDEAGTLPGVEFVPLGRRPLKGMAEEFDLFEVVAKERAGEEPERLVDPVCGLELQPGSAVARLVLDGEEQVFCCQTCLQRFVEAPERYRASAHGDAREPT